MTRNNKIVIALMCTWIVNIILSCCRPRLEKDLPPYGVTMVTHESTDAGGGAACWFADSATSGFYRRGPCL